MSLNPERQSADLPTGDCPDTSRRRLPQWEAVIPILTQRETKALSSPPAPPSLPGRAPSRLRATADSWWLVLGAQTQESLLSGNTDPSRVGKEGVPRAPAAPSTQGRTGREGPLPLRGARPRLGSPGCCPAPGLPRPRPHPRPTEPHREERKVKGRLEDQPPHPAHPAPRPPSSCPRDSPGLGARQTQDKSWPCGLGHRLSLSILLCGLGIISCGPIRPGTEAAHL